MSTKACRKCRRKLPSSSFYAQATTKDGLKAYCKKCTYAVYLDWRSSHKELHNDQMRVSKLRRQGVVLTVEMLRSMQEAQKNLCAICGSPETRKVNSSVCSLSIDHDHLTGAVRALLCNRCNVIIGYCDDSPDILRKAADYLALHSKNA